MRNEQQTGVGLHRMVELLPLGGATYRRFLFPVCFHNLKKRNKFDNDNSWTSSIYRTQTVNHYSLATLFLPATRWRLPLLDLTIVKSFGSNKSLLVRDGLIMSASHAKHVQSKTAVSRDHSWPFDQHSQWTLIGLSTDFSFGTLKIIVKKRTW